MVCSNDHRFLQAQARGRPNTFQCRVHRKPVRHSLLATHCFLDLSEAELPLTHTQAPSRSLLGLQHYVGGAPPFGVGAGISELEEERWQVPLPPPSEQLQDSLQKQLRHELRQMARDFGRPLNQLSQEQQALVQEERLRLTLGKFWGLMHEEDRPWHRPLIIHLCCLLPVNTRRLYQKLKPSTMQYTISQRSKVEKELHELYSRAQQIQRRTGWLLRQEPQRGGNRAMELQQLHRQVRHMKADAGRVLSMLKELCRLAGASFQDGDYMQYNEQQLQPVADQLAGWCDTYMQAARSKSKGTDAKGGGAAGMQLLGPRVMLPAYQAADWRYPPLQYVLQAAVTRSTGLPLTDVAPSRQGSSKTWDSVRVRSGTFKQKSVQTQPT